MDSSSGVVGRSSGINDFNEFIVSTGLLDAGFVRSRYTWTNGTLWKRLDQVLVSSSCSTAFHSFKVEHLHRNQSDHAPLFISAPFPKPTASFRFQQMWTQHPYFLQTVRLNWLNPCSLIASAQLVYKLKRLKEHLKWWNKEVFSNIFDNIKKQEAIVSQLERRYDRDPAASVCSSLSLAQAQLTRLLSMEEAFWKQKASVRWLVEGERNTHLFLNIVNKKRAINKIYRIWKGNQCLENPLDIQSSGAQFFEELLTGETTVLNKASLHLIPRLVSDRENYHLLANPSSLEVKETVLSLDPNSAVGPDGYSVHFFITC